MASVRRSRPGQVCAHRKTDEGSCHWWPLAHRAAHPASGPSAALAGLGVLRPGMAGSEEHNRRRQGWAGKGLLGARCSGAQANS
jgi:hypothetical protein